jgi:excisionase family DNA binding protein
MSRDDLADAERILAQSRAALTRHRRRGREPRILDPATHPRRYVSLVVAAAYLEIDRKTLEKLLQAGKLAYEHRGRRRKIAVSELVDFERREHTARAS